MSTLKKTIKKLLPRSIRNRVTNTYHLFEAIVANIRYRFPSRKMKVVMVTGTNGKTTTVAYIGKILEAAGYKVGVVSTAFYQIGDEFIPNEDNMTVVNTFKLQAMINRMRRAGCDHLVLEVTSHSLVQHRVWGIPCEVAVMTNLTQDHLDYHGTMENYAAAKAKLFVRQPRFIVLNRDDEWFNYFDEYRAKEVKINYGSSEQAECQIAKVELHKEGSDVHYVIDHTVKLAVHTELAGKFNVYNATAAVAACYLLRVDLKDIQKGVKALKSVPGRLQKVSIGQPFDVIVDYAHTPDALQNVLETVKALTKNRVILVFGATGDRDKTKRPIMGGIAVKLADRIILTDEESYSENPDVIRDDIRRGVESAGGGAKTAEIADRKDAIGKALSIARRGDAVLITGMGHEQFRIIGDKRVPWNDATVARSLLKKMQSVKSKK
jgi:UDP-N-acetylmuramoyl-L-alanyl-D-glutamate--2,6-diaminopimelate ligase